jgi:hypothetical protein
VDRGGLQPTSTAPSFALAEPDKREGGRRLGKVSFAAQRLRFVDVEITGIPARKASSPEHAGNPVAALAEGRAASAATAVPARRGAATRNPLVQSGLVLSGANVLPRDGLFDDGGILTAESIAGADLRQMRLAVLSACETGLGETATLGQGVFGLQRAFHMGGCRDVVASMWKVDDEATAALMALFYKHLWVDGDPPLTALRRAQLELMRSPQAVPELARSRGSKFAEVVKEVEANAARPTRTEGPAPVKHGAAFVLSGSGR